MPRFERVGKENKKPNGIEKSCLIENCDLEAELRFGCEGVAHIETLVLELVKALALKEGVAH